MLASANIEILCQSAKDLIDSEISNQKQINVHRLMRELEQNDFN